jgi:hypothetical protein
MTQFFNILNGATKGFFLDNLYKSKDVNKNVLPKPNFKDPWWKEGGGVKKNKKKTEVKKSSKSLNKTIGSRTPSPTDSDEKSSLENNFEAIPRNSIEKDQEIVNDYINKAIELIKSEYPNINIDYFVKEHLPPYKQLPSYQQLFRINRFLYQNNLANAAEKLKDKIYGGVKTNKTKKTKKSKKIKNKTRKQKGKGCMTSLPLYTDSSSDSSSDEEIREFLRTRNNRRRRNFSIPNRQIRETRQSPLSIINKTTRKRKQRKQPKPKRTKGGSKTKKLK